MYFLRKKEIPLTAFFTPAYVDIHSHLLPGIDDGAKNMEDAIALLLKMRSYGMHHFITTPHVMGSIYPNSSAVILQKLAEVQAALQEKGIADIYITAAAEYLLDEVFSARLAAGDILVLKDHYFGRNVLFQCADTPLRTTFSDTVKRLPTHLGTSRALCLLPPRF